MELLKRKNINEFIVRFPKGIEKRRLKELSDYGYNVVAKPETNAKATSKISTVIYYVSKKKMQYLGLDFKMKTYYKKGWKG